MSESDSLILFHGRRSSKWKVGDEIKGEINLTDEEEVAVDYALYWSHTGWIYKIKVPKINWASSEDLYDAAENIGIETGIHTEYNVDYKLADDIDIKDELINMGYDGVRYEDATPDDSRFHDTWRVINSKIITKVIDKWSVVREDDNRENPAIEQKIIDLKKKKITLGRYQLKLIMAYPCPFDKYPLIAYWQTKDGGPGVQDIRSALDDSGFEGYRVFETEGGQGFEYDLEKDPKKRHEHNEGTYYSSVIWKPYLSLNPAFALRNLVAATTGTEVSQVEMYPVPEALALIENMRDDESYFRVVDDIIGHGKPLFFFNWSKWADQWTYGYADRDSKMEQMQRLLGSKEKMNDGGMEKETKRLLKELADLGVNEITSGFDRGVIEGDIAHGSPIGSWHLMWDFRDGGRDVYIHDLDVAPKFHGRGYGRRIYETVEAAWRRSGVKRITGEARPEVHGFWKRMGFTVGKVTYEGGAFEDEYRLMEKLLPKANRRNPSVFYRFHHADAPPLTEENAWSIPWTADWEDVEWREGTPYYYDIEGELREANRGYSAVEEPEQLYQYFKSRGFPGDHDGEVVVFKGRVVGLGMDDEYLVIPKKVLGRMKWSEFVKSDVDELFERYRNNPTLAIPIKSKAQMKHLFKAEQELRKAGVSFDTGVTVGQKPHDERHWELDWSLKGATLENPRVTFAPCFPRSKIKLIEHYVGPTLACIEKLAGQKIDFPSTVRCMTKKEIAEGRKIRDLGHDGGAGHGLLIWKGGEPVVKVNKNMSPRNILENVIHENLHIAFPDKHEVEIDRLTDSIMEGVMMVQANPEPLIRAYKSNPSGIEDIITSVIVKKLISLVME